MALSMSSMSCSSTSAAVSARMRSSGASARRVRRPRPCSNPMPAILCLLTAAVLDLVRTATANQESASIRAAQLPPAGPDPPLHDDAARLLALGVGVQVDL